MLLLSFVHANCHVIKSLVTATLHLSISDSQLGIRGFPVATTVYTNETALFTCEVRGSGVNWCIDKTCANDGPLPNTSSTTIWKPANGTFYSELRILVPLHYNNSLVKCCIVQSSSVCSPNVTLTVNYKKHGKRPNEVLCSTLCSSHCMKNCLGTISQVGVHVTKMVESCLVILFLQQGVNN